jgi:hypothetical protein
VKGATFTFMLPVNEKTMWYYLRSAISNVS